jgi:DNA-binding response OmpR family regulator
MESHLRPARGPIWREASVLVVDDEPSLRRMIRRRLEAEHFQVEEAGDGESALQLIQSRLEPFDLVLTDLSMPGIDGRQIQETLKRYRPTVAVLCMSARPEELPPVDPADSSIEVLRKPFNEAELYLAIRAELTRAADLSAMAESEILQANAELSRLARTRREIRTALRQSVDLVAAARVLRGTATPGKDRRGLWIRTSRYRSAELQELRISRVHTREAHLFCLLSDGNMVRVPLTITPGVAGPLPGVRAGLQVLGDGKWVGWYAGDARAMQTERLSLAQILAHPDAQMIVLPTSSESISRLSREPPPGPARDADTDHVDPQTGGQIAASDLYLR